MNYSESIRPFKLTNLHTQLKTPTALRIDINLPYKDGKPVEDAKRMEVYANIIELYSHYTGLVIESHQGNPGDHDFDSLNRHYRVLMKKLPVENELDFIQRDNIFTENTRNRISNLKPGQVILLDNVRYFPSEYKFDYTTDPFVKLLKGAVNTCVNDSAPTFHRPNSSMMSLPYIARTYVGMVSSKEIRVLDGIKTSKAEKSLIIGGGKPKVENVVTLLEQGVKGYAGGLNGQLILRSLGKDLGEKNNAYLSRKFKEKDFEEGRLMADHGVNTPVDFVVAHNGEKKNVALEDLAKCNEQIMDIGSGTVEKWATDLQSSEIRIRAGPLGVFESGYMNGSKLTERIMGEGLVFLGGDTSQEVIVSGLDRKIVDAGGEILISGGSGLHYLADGNFPSVDEIIRQNGYYNGQ